jgi:DNA-binding transcriptional MerR regulator
MEDMLDIGDVTRRTGLTLRALRFYEGRGLVSPLRTAGGRRIYGAGDLARLNAIVALKHAGFSLTEIAAMLRSGPIDIGRLVAARLAELDQRAAVIADARTLLLSVQSRIDRGEPIDVATLCSLIRSGDDIMDTNWRGVVDRYFSPEEQARWNEQLSAVPDLDAATYNARWFDLGGRIAEDLPLDPASAAAQAYLDEWQALLAPFTAVAMPGMVAGATSLYDRMGEWQSDQPSPFSADVWTFIKAAG